MKEAKREVSRIQMEAEARKQELAREAAAQKRAAEAARREEQARAALDRNLELQRQWRESEALKQVLPPSQTACGWECSAGPGFPFTAKQKAGLLCAFSDSGCMRYVWRALKFMFYGLASWQRLPAESCEGVAAASGLSRRTLRFQQYPIP